MRHPAIQVSFQHKLNFADFDRRTLNFQDVANEIDVKTDFSFCVGADGTYSVVRRQLMRVVRCVSHYYGHLANLLLCARAIILFFGIL